ncbi:MAG: polysaccharide biosynthesis/export family protein [Acidobacteriaceae bacterium]
MKRRTHELLSLGFLLIFLLGTMLGQSTASPDHATPAAVDADPSSAQTPARKAHDNAYVIGSDDMLGVNVWGEKDLTTDVPVRIDGKISLPLIGELQAAGETPLQLEQDITSKLRAFITQPDVTIMVLKINSEKYNVLGRVAKPGSYPLSSPTTILDAIALAGGFQDFAKQKDIYILRENAAGQQTRIPFNYKDVIRGKHPETNIRLEPHDTIVVP